MADSGRQCRAWLIDLGGLMLFRAPRSPEKPNKIFAATRKSNERISSLLFVDIQSGWGGGVGRSPAALVFFRGGGIDAGYRPYDFVQDSLHSSSRRVHIMQARRNVTTIRELTPKKAITTCTEYAHTTRKKPPQRITSSLRVCACAPMPNYT